jgi:opacity protein-like surface antigen
VSGFKLGLLLSVLPAAAFAQAMPGPYASGAVGAAIPSGSLRSIGKLTKIDLDTGVSVVAAAGWRFSNGVRAELQGGYQSNNVGDISTLRVNGYREPLAGVGGHLSTYSAMANLIYDLPVHGYVGPVQPYVGAGIGYGSLDFNGAGGVGRGTLHLPRNNTYNGPVLVKFGSAGAFAYQAIAGVAYPLNSLPGLKLTAEYRFFGTARADVPVSRTAAGVKVIVNGAAAAVSTHNGFMAADHSLMLGVRYNFGGR